MVKCAEIPEFTCGTAFSIFFFYPFYIFSSILLREGERASAWEIIAILIYGLYYLAAIKKTHTKRFDDDNLRSERSGVCLGVRYRHTSLYNISRLIMCCERVIVQVSKRFFVSNLLSLFLSLQVCLRLSLSLSLAVVAVRWRRRSFARTFRD
jgi:hypothetical protein